MTRSREVFDYTNKGAVVDSFIVAPQNASETLTERQSLWQAVEQGERRKDAQLAREMILALPRELTLQANAELVREFVTGELVSRGMIADVAIHNPMASDGKSNPHAHVMLTSCPTTARASAKKPASGTPLLATRQGRAARAVSPPPMGCNPFANDGRARSIPSWPQPMCWPESRTCQTKPRASSANHNPSSASTGTATPTTRAPHTHSVTR